MPYIKAVEKRNITVEVEPKELFQGLASHFGLYQVFDHSADERFREIKTPGGNLTALQKEVDISYHGSPCWEEEGAPITDDRPLKAYQLLKQLKQLL